MSLDSPIKLYQNPCETIGLGKCRESNGIDSRGVTLRRCRRASHELVPQCSLPLEYGREPLSQKPWTMTWRKMLSWGLVWGEAEKGDEEPPGPQRRNDPKKLGRESPARPTGGSLGYEASLRRFCVKRKRPMEFLIGKDPQMGMEEK